MLIYGIAICQTIRKSFVWCSVRRSEFRYTRMRDMGRSTLGSHQPSIRKPDRLLPRRLFLGFFLPLQIRFFSYKTKRQPKRAVSSFRSPLSIPFKHNTARSKTSIANSSKPHYPQQNPGFAYSLCSTRPSIRTSRNGPRHSCTPLSLFCTFRSFPTITPSRSRRQHAIYTERSSRYHSTTIHQRPRIQGQVGPCCTLCCAFVRTDKSNRHL